MSLTDLSQPPLLATSADDHLTRLLVETDRLDAGTSATLARGVGFATTFLLGALAWEVVVLGLVRLLAALRGASMVHVLAKRWDDEGDLPPADAAAAARSGISGGGRHDSAVPPRREDVPPPSSLGHRRESSSSWCHACAPRRSASSLLAMTLCGGLGASAALVLVALDVAVLHQLARVDCAAWARATVALSAVASTASGATLALACAARPGHRGGTARRPTVVTKTQRRGRGWGNAAPVLFRTLLLLVWLGVVGASFATVVTWSGEASSSSPSAAATAATQRQDVCRLRVRRWFAIQPLLLACLLGVSSVGQVVHLITESSRRTVSTPASSAWDARIGEWEKEAGLAAQSDEDARDHLAASSLGPCRSGTRSVERLGISTLVWVLLAFLASLCDTISAFLAVSPLLTFSLAALQVSRDHASTLLPTKSTAFASRTRPSSSWYVGALGDASISSPLDDATAAEGGRALISPPRQRGDAAGVRSSIASWLAGACSVVLSDPALDATGAGFRGGGGGGGDVRGGEPLDLFVRSSLVPQSHLRTNFLGGAPFVGTLPAVGVATGWAVSGPGRQLATRARGENHAGIGTLALVDPAVAGASATKASDLRYVSRTASVSQGGDGGVEQQQQQQQQQQQKRIKRWSPGRSSLRTDSRGSGPSYTNTHSTTTTAAAAATSHRGVGGGSMRPATPQRAEFRADTSVLDPYLDQSGVSPPSVGALAATANEEEAAATAVDVLADASMSAERVQRSTAAGAPSVGAAFRHRRVAEGASASASHLPDHMYAEGTSTPSMSWQEFTALSPRRGASKRGSSSFSSSFSHAAASHAVGGGHASASGSVVWTGASAAGDSVRPAAAQGRTYFHAHNHSAASDELPRNATSSASMAGRASPRPATAPSSAAAAVVRAQRKHVLDAAARRDLVASSGGGGGTDAGIVVDSDRGQPGNDGHMALSMSTTWSHDDDDDDEAEAEVVCDGLEPAWPLPPSEASATSGSSPPSPQQPRSQLPLAASGLLTPPTEVSEELESTPSSRTGAGVSARFGSPHGSNGSGSGGRARTGSSPYPTSLDSVARAAHFAAPATLPPPRPPRPPEPLLPMGVQGGAAGSRPPDGAGWTATRDAAPTWDAPSPEVPTGDVPVADSPAASGYGSWESTAGRIVAGRSPVPANTRSAAATAWDRAARSSHRHPVEERDGTTTRPPPLPAPPSIGPCRVGASPARGNALSLRPSDDAPTTSSSSPSLGRLSSRTFGAAAPSASSPADDERASRSANSSSSPRAGVVAASGGGSGSFELAPAVSSSSSSSSSSGVARGVGLGLLGATPSTARGGSSYSAGRGG